MKIVSNILLAFVSYILVCYPKEILRYMFFKKVLNSGEVYKSDFPKKPFKCIDPVGFVTYVFFDIGWSKGPVLDIYKLKKDKRAVYFAILGPILGLILFLVYAFSARLSNSSIFFQIFYTSALWSLTYTIISIFPLPPLDGSKFILAGLDERKFEWYIRYNFYGIIFMLGLVFLWILPNIMYPLRKIIVELTNYIVYNNW